MNHSGPEEKKPICLKIKSLKGALSEADGGGSCKGVDVVSIR